LKQQKLPINNGLLIRRFEKLDAIASFKEIELEQAQHVLQGHAQLGLEFQKAKEQVHAQGNPDLRQHRIARCAQKRLDVEVVLEQGLMPRWEKCNDLPEDCVKWLRLLRHRYKQ
jgi:hypothetical protein